MGRRSDHSRDDLRAMIVEAARAILATDGLRGLTARRIAKSIGYSPGTLYNFFSNLDALILHVNAQTLDAVYDRLSAASGRGGTPEAVLRAFARAYIDCTREQTHLWDAVLEHRLPEGQDLPDWYTLRIGRLFNLVEDALVPLLGPGSQEPRRRAARVLWSALHGLSSLALSRKLEIVTEESVEAMADHLVITYLAGLKATGAG